MDVVPLQWIDGPPPNYWSEGGGVGDPNDPDDYFPTIETNAGPVVLEMKDGSLIVVGECNQQGGICGCCNHEGRLVDVVRWAKLEFSKEGMRT